MTVTQTGTPAAQPFGVDLLVFLLAGEDDVGLQVRDGRKIGGLGTSHAPHVRVRGPDTPHGRAHQRSRTGHGDRLG
jgi:hypothetical protein